VSITWFVSMVFLNGFSIASAASQEVKPSNLTSTNQAPAITNQSLSLGATILRCTDAQRI
jgi:hypothetical protein